MDEDDIYLLKPVDNTIFNTYWYETSKPYKTTSGLLDNNDMDNDYEEEEYDT